MGDALDGVRALVELVQGNLGEAGLMALGVLPFFAGGGARAFREGLESLIQTGVRRSDDLTDLGRAGARQTTRAGEEALQTSGRQGARAATRPLDETTGAARGVTNEVPAYAGGKTSGTLVRPDGSEIPLVSGWSGPASAMPKGTPGMNLITKAHVEAHAAAVMRTERLSEATLWINRAPCAGPTGCATLLPRMVPTGSTLTVHIVPSGSGGRIAGTLVVEGVG